MSRLQDGKGAAPDPYAAPPRVRNRTSSWLGLLVIACLLALLGDSEYHIIRKALESHVRIGPVSSRKSFDVLSAVALYPAEKQEVWLMTQAPPVNCCTVLNINLPLAGAGLRPAPGSPISAVRQTPFQG